MLNMDYFHFLLQTVKLALYKNQIKVAVKMMKEGSMSEDDFIDEAKTMKYVSDRLQI